MENNNNEPKFNFLKCLELRTIYNDDDLNPEKIFDALQTYFPYTNEMSHAEKKTFIVSVLEQLSTFDKAEKWKRLKREVQAYHY
jgi:hypothetical protein